jgi:four helix bundle protein
MLSEKLEARRAAHLRFMNDLKARTKKFALDIIFYCRTLPRTDEFIVIKRQLIRSGASVAANYRATRRAKSKADFITKWAQSKKKRMNLYFWLECLAELATKEHAELNRWLKEADELTAIFVSSRKRARE